MIVQQANESRCVIITVPHQLSSFERCRITLSFHITTVLGSPSLDALPVRFEDESSESFGQMICVLLLRRAFDDLQPSVWIVFAVTDARPKEVQLGIEVSAPWRESLIRRWEKRTLIIFE